MHTKKFPFPFVLFALALVACDPAPKPAEPALALPDADQAVQATKPDQGVVAPEVAPASDANVAFDLIANRHLAHLLDSERALFMDMGTAGSLKYIQGGWNSTWIAPKRDGETDFAYTRGVGGTIRFPLIAGDAMEGGKTANWKVAIRLKPVGKQRCDLFMRSTNGDERKFASLTAIKDGWNNYVVDLPDGLEIGQEHTLRLHFSRSQDAGGVRAAAAIDWIRVGPNLTESTPNLPTFSPSAATANLPAQTGLLWYTMPGKKASFQAEVKGDVSLFSTTDNDRKSLATKGPWSAPLDAFAMQAIRLEIQATTDSVVTSPAIVTPKAEAKTSDVRPQIVLVWIIDTLRADHLKLYNPDTDVLTPRLDALAKDAAVFKSATVQGNSSLPSSASVFSSAYPPNHKLTSEKAKLPEDHVLFGEAFKNGGWATGLFSSNGYVSNSWGFARGFDIEVNPIRENRPSDAEYLWPDTKAWIEKQVQADPAKKLLVYMNPVDPHVPYDPPTEQLKHYDARTGTVGKVSPRGTGQLLHDMAKGGIKLSADEAKYMHALYKGEISYNDVWLGKLMDDLKAMGLLDKTMIIITSDHGEEFDEYGKYGHGISVNQELVDVPFLVYFTPWTKGGMEVTEDVETVDMMPTALDAAGLDIPDSVQGVSLLELIQHPVERHPRPAFSYHNDFLRSARMGNLKYQLFHGDKDPVYELKQPAFGTPWDNQDVGDAKPIARRVMRDLMAFQVGLDTKLHKRTDGFPNNHSAKLAKTLDTMAK